MEIMEFLKQNKDAFSGIPNANEVMEGIIGKMKELGYTALANNAKEPLYVGKGQFDQINSQVGELNKQLENLKKSAKGNEELTKTIEELQTKNQSWEEKYKGSMLENTIKLSAIKANAKDVADVLALIDRSKLTVKDDNSVEGLDEILSGLKESKGYLFGETVQPGTGANPAGNKTVTTDQKAANDFAAGLKGY